MGYPIPSTQAEHTAARNRSTDCKHVLSTLAVLEEQPSPTLKNPNRVHQKLWCAECGAIKYANCFGSDPKTRKGIQNGLPMMGSPTSYRDKGKNL